MPLRFGGDMDDPDNPASPFMKREDVEQVAAEELGLSEAEFAEATGEQRKSVTLSKEEGLQLLCDLLIGRIRTVRKNLQATRGMPLTGLRRTIADACQDLDDVLPVEKETQAEAAEASEHGS